MKTVAIAGVSGFIGTHLKNHFIKKGFRVSSIGIETYKNENKLLSILEDADIVINLSGANIIHRWSDSYKKILRSSRIDTTKILVDMMAKATKKPNLFISTSAIGVYQKDEIHDEYNFTYGDDFLAKLALDWEYEALKAEAIGVRTVIFRFSVVLGKDGGVLAKMLPPFRFGLGGTIGDGNIPFSFIHINDLIRAYDFIIEHKELNGAFNLVSPTPTTNKSLTKALGNSLHRPTLFPVPKFVFKVLYGEGSVVLLDGASVKPKRLLENGFEFAYPTIESAINDLLG